MSDAKQLALMAGIPVKKKADGTEFVTVSQATARYLFSEPRPYLAPLVCTCPQRPYPHELSVHAELRAEWWPYRHAPKWPWSLMLSVREEPSTERKVAA
jgi:hypothetical protein